ncbi:extracellular ribonuclease LE-like [Rosa rugosa]|uniref:extracellular ribonuclease LE-like n=1 Tax=Rosa rugosa TaxID=74645 RepID=UPI002B40230C|nr:extracellular ribonuclease LE-like [Rosa rugosa]
MVQSQQPTAIPTTPFNETKVSGIIDDLQKYWPLAGLPEQQRDILKDIHGYLQDYGIRPDGTAYNLNTLKYYLRKSFLGLNIGIEYNEDASGNSQYYQIHICIDPSGKFMIKCPVLADEKCADSFVFPSF